MTCYLTKFWSGCIWFVTRVGLLDRLLLICRSANRQRQDGSLRTSHNPDAHDTRSYGKGRIYGTYKGIPSTDRRGLVLRDSPLSGLMFSEGARVGKEVSTFRDQVFVGPR